MQIQRKHRFETLDGMRGVAAIAVMLLHMTSQAGLPVLRGANVAVDLFYCLSGFVIADAYAGRLANGMPLSQFLLRRLIRLYPMFLIGLVLGSAALFVKVYLGQTDLGLSGAGRAVVLNALYLPYIGNFHIQIGREVISSAIFPVNDPGWSLFFELLVNVAFGAAFLSARRPPAALIATLSAALLVIYVGITHRGTPGWASNNLIGGLPRVFFGFYAGVFLHEMVRSQRMRIPRFPPSAILAVLTVLFLITTTALLWLGVTLIAVPLIVLFGSVSEPRGAAAHAAAGYLGWISYPLYCIHFPIYSLAGSLFGEGWAPMIGAAILSLISAHLLSRLVEEPVRDLLARRLLRPPSTTESGPYSGEGAAR